MNGWLGSAAAGWALAALLLALLVAAWLWAAARARFRAWRARRRARHAVRGERAAERLLEGRGYRVVARQPALVWVVEVDGEPIEVELRCDLVVERRGRRLVAEVKTGGAAPLLGTAATRRQLLEYRVAYGADGALLVDADRGVVQEVTFSGLAGPRLRASAPGLAAALLLGAALGAATALLLGRGL